MLDYTYKIITATSKTPNGVVKAVNEELAFAGREGFSQAGMIQVMHVDGEFHAFQNIARRSDAKLKVV